MKPWIKRTLFGIAGAGLLVGLSACGHRGHGPMSEEQLGEMRGKAVLRISEKLELDAAQKSKLEVLADALMAQRQALKAGGEGRAEMAALIAGPQFDRAKAQSLLDQKTQAVQGQGPKVITALADFYDSLTPAQQAQVRERLSERRGHGWWGRG